MARDVYFTMNRYEYCGRPGFIPWDVDLHSCSRETCKALAFTELRRRHRNGRELPENRLAKALLRSLETIDEAVRADERAELVSPKDAARIRDGERRATARVLSDLHELARRYPTPPAIAEPEPDPRYRRFVYGGRLVPLRRRPKHTSAHLRMIEAGEARTIHAWSA